MLQQIWQKTLLDSKKQRIKMLWEMKIIAQSVRLVRIAHMKMIDLKKTPRVSAN